MNAVRGNVRHLRTAIGGFWMAVVLAGCQTAQRADFTDVSLARTKFVLPAKWAEDVSARARDEGSLRTEQLFFKGGFLSYDQYYRGGFRTRTPDDLIELAKRIFDHATFGEPQLTTVPLGQIRYLTLQVPDKETCFVLLANQGPFTQLQGGRGKIGRAHV